jgi:putative endonuclease
VSDRYAFIATYIMASRPFGVLYTGVTSNLMQRVCQHREGLLEGFAKEHGCKMLVWYEQHETMAPAIAREKAIKHYVRVWKLNLIEQLNPGWVDLYPELFG